MAQSDPARLSAARSWLTLAIALGACRAPATEAPLAPGPPAHHAAGGGLHLDAALNEAARQRAFSGALLITSGDRVVAQRSAGFGDEARRQPLTTTSPFAVGSLAKQVTAALVLREVDAGRVQLDAPIGAYVTLSMPWKDRVQVQQLLNHTSGLDALDRPLKREPGVAFEYSNLGYDLLGRLVERSSGAAYSDAVAELFSRCGITSRATLNDAAAEPVVGWVEAADRSSSAVAVPAETREHLPSGGLVASVEDMLAWSRCLHAGKAISSESYELMTTSSSTRAHRWGELGYGFGLQILDSEGLFELSHSGYLPGFVSTLIVYPRQCVTVVILENVATPATDLSRAFAPHDAVRNAVRAALRRSAPNECASLTVAGAPPKEGQAAR